MLLFRNFEYLLNESFLLENLGFAKGFQLLLGEQIFPGVKLPYFTVSASDKEFTNYLLVYLVKLNSHEFSSDHSITKACYAEV